MVTREFKTMLFYIAGLVGLVLTTTLFTSQGNLAEVNPLPVIAADASRLETGQAKCPLTPLWPGLPDHVSTSPFTYNLIPPNREGDRLIISGTVYAADCVTPLPDVLIEVWHPNPEGQHADPSGPFTLRGQMRTDAEGRYQFITLKPDREFNPYEPARSEYLPAHIRYRISYQNNSPLVTHLYFAGDRFLRNAPTALPELTIPLTEQMEPTGSVWRGTFDLVLPVTPPLH